MSVLPECSTPGTEATQLTRWEDLVFETISTAPKPGPRDHSVIATDQPEVSELLRDKVKSFTATQGVPELPSGDPKQSWGGDSSEGQR